ncbi:MAG: glycosyltransferase family 2 protein [Lachnospiraceae bacterium]|nr:glycosyltransferase family 2 protein [Lachnospiraceae bacterium]
MSIKVSVIVTVYNEELYIRECLDSIMSQTYDNCEVIVVDDGSKDGSRDICLEYKDRDNVTLIFKENGGQSSARKKGLYTSTGEAVIFVDGDDWLEPDHIQNLTSKFGADVDMVTSGSIMRDGDKVTNIFDVVPEGEYNCDDIRSKILPDYICDKVSKKQIITQFITNKLFRIDCAKKGLEYVDERIRFNEDGLALCKVLVDAKKIVVTRYAGHNYRQHATSICHSPKKELLCGLPLLEKGYNELLGNIISKKEILDQICMNTMHVFLDAALSDYNIKMVRRFVTPWKIINANTKVAIYGAGQKGSLYRDEIEQETNVVLWVDKNYSSIKRKYEVQDPMELLNIQFDVLLIAIENEYIQMDVQSELIAKGIKSDKIWPLRTELVWEKTR